MPVLVVEKGPDRGKTFSFSDNEMIAGRGVKTQVKLSETQVSREHFRIYRQGNDFFIEDMGSLNGTQVNGQTITRPMQLSDCDEIAIGETSFSWMEKEQTPEKDPLINQKLGGYLILARLGRGGMGTVYRARQLSLQRDVALKLLNPRLGVDNNFIKRFVDEARASATLNHPNILQVFDVAEDNGRYYFSMEYAAKGSIQQLIEGQKQLSLELGLPYMLETARGLEYAERKKIVHRDIKPDNLMLSEENIVKIGDLGLAKRINQKGAKEEKEQIFGTPHFISPEQVQGLPVDHRADMYSCGASFYRIFAGRTPFQSENIRALVLKHIMEDPPLLQEVAPDLPDGLCQIIQKMMQKDPVKRYSSNTDLIEALEDFKANYLTGKSKTKTTTSTKTNSSTKAMSRTGALRRESLRRAGTGSIKKDQMSRSGNSSQLGKGATSSKNNILLYLFPGVILLAFLGLIVFGGSQPKPAPYKPPISDQNPPVDKQPGNKQPGDKTNSDTKDPVTPDNKKPPQDDDPAEHRGEKLLLAAKKTANPKEAIQKLERVIEEFSGKKIAQKAQNEIDHIQKTIEQKLREQIALLRKCKENKELAKGLTILAKLRQELDGFASLQEQLLVVQTEMEAALLQETAHIRTEFLKHLQAGKFKEARKSIQWLQQMEQLVSGSCQEEIGKQIEFWENEIEKGQNAERQIMLEYDKALESCLHHYRFVKGALELQGYVNKFRSPDYQDEVKKAVRDLPKLDQLLQQCDGRIKDGKLLVLDHIIEEGIPKLPALAQEGETKLTGIKDGKLLLQIIMEQGGKIEHNVSLGQITPQWIYDNLLYSPTAPVTMDMYGLALYCFYYKLYAQGWELCQKLSKPKADHPEIAELKKEFEAVETTAQNGYGLLVKKYRELQKEWQSASLTQRKGLQKQLQQLQKDLEQYQKEYEFTRYFKQISDK